MRISVSYLRWHYVFISLELQEHFLPSPRCKYLKQGSFQPRNNIPDRRPRVKLSYNAAPMLGRVIMVLKILLLFFISGLEEK